MNQVTSAEISKRLLAPLDVFVVSPIDHLLFFVLCRLQFLLDCDSASKRARGGHPIETGFHEFAIDHFFGGSSLSEELQLVFDDTDGDFADY